MITPNIFLMNKRKRLYLAGAALVVLLNAAAWNSAAFSDWYIEHIFPLWVGTYGRVTGLFSFSVGEWMLAAGAAAAVLALVLGMLWILLGIRLAVLTVKRLAAGGSESGSRSRFRQSGGSLGEARWAEGRESAPERGSFFRRVSLGYGRFLAWTLLTLSLVMTLNCFILYHASPIFGQYTEEENEYSLTELISLYNMAAERCNSLAEVIERDGSGMALYKGRGAAEDTLRDMADEARELMRALGETYPRLQGYYPRPKPLRFSDFMCQQHMQGYYFPFSMEANYNDVMYILNIPSSMCHELAHLRGYIYEDEANFIGYLACLQSEDDFFRYAGYLSVLTYLNNDLYRAWKDNPEAFREAAAEIQPVTVDDRVWEDNIFVTQEEWDRINGKALIDTEIVDKAADAFIDTNLKVNGVAEGKKSYSKVVRLLLQYYRLMQGSS